MRRNLLVWKCQVDPSLRNIHSHRRATHKSSYYTDMQRQTFDTSSQEWNPPLKMQSRCNGGRLSIEVMNTTPLSHTEKMLKGQFIYMCKWTFCLFFYSPSYCSKHIWYAPKTTKSILKIVHRTHTLHSKCSEATILQEKTKTKAIFLVKIFSYIEALNILFVQIKYAHIQIWRIGIKGKYHWFLCVL